MLDTNRILTTVRRATVLLRATPGRVGSIVELKGASDVLVVGDLHGHLHVVSRAIEVAALDANPARHLVLQELVHDTRVDPDADDDRAIDRSHRLLALACALKIRYPDRVHIILGNHELSELTDRSIGKKGVYLNALFREGIERDHGDDAPTVIAAYKELFTAMPLAVRTPNRVLMCHTVPNDFEIDGLDRELLGTGVWPPEALRRHGTVYAMTWGRDLEPETADHFAAFMDVDLFVIGHHSCDDGFRHANPRVLVLDGTDPKPYGCLFPAEGPIAMDTLVAGLTSLAPAD